MTAKHTPGPWTIERTWDDEFSRGSFNVVAYDETPYRLVLASRAPWSTRADESDANGRLIAAAPEMLEALKACLTLFEADLHYKTPPISMTVTAMLVQDVLKKAEGET